MEKSAVAQISMPAKLPVPGVERAYLWSGEFADPEMEAHFRNASWNETVERMRFLQPCVLLFAAWGFVDYYIFGPSLIFVALLAGRLGAVVIARMPIVFFAARESYKAFYASVSFVQAYIFSVFLVLVGAGGMTAADHALGAVIFLAAFYFGTPNRLVYNLLISLLSTAGLVALLATYPEMTLQSFITTLSLLAIVNGVGVQSVRVASRLRRNTFLTLMHQRETNEQLTKEIAVRQEAQRAVRATEESFQSIFLAAPLPLALVDTVTFRVMQANKAALDLFGLRESEASSVDARDFFVDDVVRDQLSKAAVPQKSRKPLEVCLQGAHGEIIWAHISAALIRFHGLPAYLVGLQDVTARHKEAEALREARDQATAANRSKSEFLANMSHELRTPLNAIIGFSEALERELFGPVGNPRYREYAEDIHDSGVHLLNLINDILDLSKIEAGHFNLHEEEVELDHIVASACRIVRPRAQQASIRVETSLPTPPVVLLADERALKQVLINLISNAIKFSSDGDAVRVEANIHADGLRIAVIDQGIGIAADDIPKALEPFTQIDGTLSRSHEGTGLGLPLAKHLAELHGGSLTIESTPGQGTTVNVDLPADCLVARRARIHAV